MDLRSKWEKQKRDIEELNYICFALDNNCEDFDPTFFTNCRSAYLDHIKTCYYLEKNGWVFIIWSIWEGRLYSSTTY